MLFFFLFFIRGEKKRRKLGISAFAKHGLNNFYLYILDIMDKPFVLSNLTTAHNTADY
jgi:hypothetical protein